MTYPVLERVQRRDRRRRRQIRRRRLTALLVLSTGIAVAVWQLWPVKSTGAVEAAQAAGHTRPANTAKPAESEQVPKLVFGPARLQAHSFTPRLSSRSAILVDGDSGRVLWKQHAHVRRPVASTTKIMTALLALERLSPHTVVTVAKSVPRVPLVREGLRAGERVQAWKLFYGMMLYSGNDDALALAIAAGGTRSNFVHAMNARARALGLNDTHFRSPSGVIDVDNYSSAWDLAALTRVALRNNRFRTIVRTKVEHVSWAAPTYAKIYVNHNLLIGSYPGANGVKTGYTHKAGHCLVASATRGGRTLIAVVLNDPNMYVDAKRLLNLGFRGYS